MSKISKRGKGFRRGLSILLTFALLFGMTAGFSGPALAAESVLTPSNNGTVTAVNGGNYTISASGTYTGWRFIVPNGVTATLTVSGTLTLNNQNGGGSPIDVQAGGSLTLVVNGALTAYGWTSGNGEANNASLVAGGRKGYAGISVPNGAALLISGSGTLAAYGGDAGNGGDLTGTSNGGSGGGGGAGAGIGGNGGDGGGGATQQESVGQPTKPVKGEDSGNITIAGTVSVAAYGGSGGSAGLGATQTSHNTGNSGGSGAGGYPAAGIGGGGGGASGGTDVPAGGGFSGGAGGLDHTQYNLAGTNGSGGLNARVDAETINGGGYFSAGQDLASRSTLGLIGGGKTQWSLSTQRISHDGAAGGSGGSVKIYSDSSKVRAYNGSYITTAASGASGNSWGQNPTPIYAQLGYSLDSIRAKNIRSVAARTDAAMSSELASKGVAKTIATTGVSGIGSGAGYTEGSNGTVQYGTRLDLGTLTADLHLTPDTNNGVPYILFGI